MFSWNFFFDILADKIDYSHITLTDKTFYERVYPSVDELEYSGPELDNDKFGLILGRVKFGLEYDVDCESLLVTIFEARDLPAADEGKT